MQRGHIRKTHGAWFVRFYSNKKQRSVRLGSLKDFPTKRSVRPVADEMVRRFQIAGVGRSSKLDEFIEYWYLPALHVRPSTAKGYEGLFQRYIKGRPEAGLQLWEYNTAKIQELLRAIAAHPARTTKRVTPNQIMTAAPTLTKATLQHVKHFLSGVFRHANVTGIHEGNPVTLAYIPACSLPAGQTGVYTLTELSAVLAVLPLFPRAVVAMAGFAGLRRAELQGLLWSDYSGDSITVNQTEWRGHVSPPKSVASANFVPVIPQLRDTMDAYQRSLGAKATGPIFPVDLDHMGRRTVKAAMKKVGLPWRGWHAFRRGLASNLFALGADDITVQRVLRHSKVQVTRAHYIKIRDPKLEAAMDGLSRAMDTEVGRDIGRVTNGDSS